MRVRMVGQPLQEATNLYEYLRDVSSEASIDRLRIAVAWAKRSGLVRVRSEIERFRNRGGQITAIIGISEGGASRQGLRIVKEICDESYVFHDPHRTFHPKLYLANGMESAEIFVGSNNLTAGGAYWNYELAVWISLDLNRNSDYSLYQQFDAWYESLIADLGVCRPLDESLYRELVRSTRYRIADEDIRASDGKGEPSVSDSVQEDSRGTQLFGRSGTRKKRDPLGTLTSTPVPEPSATDEPIGAGPEEIRPAEHVSVVKRWSKKLSSTDAQQPPGANSNVTGHLKLTQARHSIDQKTYFREEFFGDLTWTSIQKERGELETATASIELVVNGLSHGFHDIKIDHAGYRVAKQNNVPTWLHWNEYTSSYLRNNRHVDDYISLEKTADGKYRLVIENTLPHEFIK